MTSNTPPTELVSRVTATLGEDEVSCPDCDCKFGFTDAQVNRVIVAAAALQEGGEPVGTTKLGPNGEVAVRVDSPKGPLWRVVQPDGAVIENTQPTLKWDVLQPKTIEETV